MLHYLVNYCEPALYTHTTHAFLEHYRHNRANHLLFTWQRWLDASDRWKRREITQPCLSVRVYISFIPSHMSSSVNLLSARVSFKLHGDFLNLKLLENCCQPLSSDTSRAFVPEVCTAESEINCTFIAQPDERLGKCSGVINRTLLQIAALADGLLCCVSFMQLIITGSLALFLLKHQHCQLIHFSTSTVRCTSAKNSINMTSIRWFFREMFIERNGSDQSVALHKVSPCLYCILWML